MRCHKRKMNENYNIDLYYMINNLRYKTHRQRLRRFILQNRSVGNYGNLMRTYGVGFNFRTERFVEYGGTYLTQRGRLRRRRRVRGYSMVNEIIGTYWTDIRNILINAQNNEEIIYDIPLNTPATNADIIGMMNEILGNDNNHYLVVFGNTGYSLNATTLGRLNLYMNGVVDGNQNIITESDQQFINYIQDIDSFSIENRGQLQGIADGAFFGYYYTKGNLKKYQIFKNKKDADYKENCVVKSLIESKKLNKKTITELKMSGLVNRKYINKKQLSLVAKKIKHNICVKELREISTERYNKIKDNKRKKVWFDEDKNKKYLDVLTYYWNDKENKDYIRIGLIDKHYFIIDNNNIYDFIRELFLHKRKHKLKKIKIEDKIIISENYDKINYEFGNLKYSNDCIEPFEYKELRDEYKTIHSDIWFADFEACGTATDYHKEYACCVLNIEGTLGKKFKGWDCAEKFINWICRKSKKKELEYMNKKGEVEIKKLPIIVFYHNLSYDINFIYKIKGLRIDNRIAPNNNEIRVETDYFGRKIIFRDTLCMLPMGLGKFGNVFKIDQEKEVLPYDIYTEENVNKRYIKKDEILKMRDFDYFKIETKLKEILEERDIDYMNDIECKIEKLHHTEKWKIFLQNVEKWGCWKDITKKEYIDIVKYSVKYCLIDCEVLRKGYLKFRTWMLKLTKLDILDLLTITGLADKYLLKTGCYKGINQISGIPRLFIQRCLVGGKSMTNSNKIWKTEFLNKDNEDFDIKSSYPYAMTKMGGFLKGKPKVLTRRHRIKINNNWKYLNKFDGYFVRILVEEIDAMDYPLLSYKNEDGTRIFTNDIYELNKFGVFIDKFTLEDCVNICNMKFKIIKGYYFDEGRNLKLKPTIQNLYDERVIKKKQKNPIQSCYKLILNGSFGRTLMKAFKFEEVIVYGEDAGKKYVCRYYNQIDDFKIIDKQIYCKKDKIYKNDKIYFVKKMYSVGEHFNRCHCGVEVLGMSKRTLNKPLCLASRNNIKVGIIDTDSIQLSSEGLKKLKLLYTEKYGTKLEGKKLGDFDGDLEITNNNNLDEKLNGIGEKLEAISKSSIYNTKKNYCHLLYNKENNIYDWHLRLKGISTKSLYYYCYKYKLNPLQIYTQMSCLEKKDAPNFDLTCGGYKCRFEKDRVNNTIKYKRKFERQVWIK